MNTEILTQKKDTNIHTNISYYTIFTKEEWEKRFSWTKQNI